MSEIDFFNSDGSINFRNMDDTRRSFETNFSKKYLGSVMKNLVANCIFDKNVKEGLKNNEGLKLYLNNAVNQIAENAFDERDSNRNTFTGAMTETVEKYSSMEGNYRYEKALFVANGKESKEYKNKKINTIFSAENFLSDEIEKQFKDEFSFKHGYEAEELVIEVGKEIGEMIAEAETKQVIMEQTMSAIADEKENIRKELGVDEEKDEETETSEDGDGDGEMPEEGGDEGDGDIDENDDSTDDSDENIDDESEGEDDTESEELGDSSDDDEPDTENEDQSEGEESYDEIGLEKLFLNDRDREEAIDLIQKNRSKYISELRKIINNINEKVKKVDKDFEKKYGIPIADLVKRNFVEDKGYVDKKIKELENALDYIINNKSFTGNSKRKIKVPLMIFRYEKRNTYVAKMLVVLFLSILGGVVWELVSRLYDKNKMKYQSGTDIITSESKLPFMKTFVRNPRGKDEEREFITFEVGILFDFSLRKILKHGGMEDYEGIHNIEKQLLNRYMDNLSSYYEDVDLSEIEENIYSDMTSDENGETLIKLPNGVVSKEEYIKKIYSAENISNVLVPLSPVKLDNMEIPSLDAMSAIFTRATEDINSIRSIMGARLEMLGDIVSKESDEELSGKFENLKSVALESIERADVIRDIISRFRITPFGLESDDRGDILIARNLYNFVNDKYKLSSITPKNFDSMEDAINAAFDIGMIKKSYLDTESLEDYNEIQERENRFWESMVKMDLDNDRKTQIENILKLQDLDLGGGFIVDPAFEKSLKLATKANPLKASPTKSENEINDMIFDRVVERMKNIELVDDIDQQSKELIRSLINGTDPVGYLNTPFEKLLIDEGKNNSNDMEGDFELSAESKDAYNRAFLGVTIHSFVNRIKPFSEETLNRFNKYMIPERI